MPHIILECSDNLVENHFKTLLQQIHELLSEKLPTDLVSCKSRVQRYADFMIADGGAKHAFVHLAIAVMKGRNKELLDRLSATLLEQLGIAFKASAEKFQLHLSVEIRELSDVYHKKSFPLLA